MLSSIILLATTASETVTQSVAESVADTVQQQNACCESLNNFFTSIWNGIDWSQFIPTLIATFIGFALAILGSYLYDNYKDKNERKTIIANLHSELEEMKSELSRIANTLTETDSTTLWISPLKTYIWDSTAANNKLGLLSNQSWYKDLLVIYHTVHEYNSWHQLRTNSVISEQDYEVIENSMSEIATTLNTEIDAILPSLTDKKEKR